MGVNMKYAALLIFLACTSLVCAGQTPSPPGKGKCVLTRAESPEIRGIRLGMTPDQLLAVYPEDLNRLKVSEAIKESKRATNYGVGRFDLRPDRETPNPRFKGLNYITIELLDERVTSFHIGYAGPQWSTADQFVEKLSEALHLPREPWEGRGGVSQSLKCDGFVVNAYASSDTAQNWVQVHDTSAPQVVEDRRQLAKEKERQAFRP